MRKATLDEKEIDAIQEAVLKGTKMTYNNVSENAPNTEQARVNIELMRKMKYLQRLVVFNIVCLMVLAAYTMTVQ